MIIISTKKAFMYIWHKTRVICLYSLLHKATSNYTADFN